MIMFFVFFFQAEDGIRDFHVTGVQTCALPISGPDTTNPAVGKWYDYSMLSHLLTSKRHVYGVRTPAGKYAKLELVAYYCEGAGTACVTFRYAYQGNGTPRVGL